MNKQKFIERADKEIDKVIVCKRCGKCCYPVDKEGNRIIEQKCKYLLKTLNGKYICRIYKNRIGIRLADGFCNLRIKSDFNYPDCPYNVLTPDKPMVRN